MHVGTPAFVLNVNVNVSPAKALADPHMVLVEVAALAETSNVRLVPPSVAKKDDNPIKESMYPTQLDMLSLANRAVTFAKSAYQLPVISVRGGKKSLGHASKIYGELTSPEANNDTTGFMIISSLKVAVALIVILPVYTLQPN